MMFSQRVHESSVQFVEPVQTDSPSRTANLWCMRSGTPGNRLRRHLEAVDERRLAARRREERWGLLAVDVEGKPHGDAPLLGLDHGAGDDLGGRLEEVEVVEGEVEAPAGRVEEPREAVRDLGRGLAAVGERVRLEHEAGR